MGTELTDEQLLARRLELDQIQQEANRELAMLNREYERREWARHEAAQAAVSSAAVVHAAGDGVTTASV